MRIQTSSNGVLGNWKSRLWTPARTSLAGKLLDYNCCHMLPLLYAMTRWGEHTWESAAYWNTKCENFPEQSLATLFAAGFHIFFLEYFQLLWAKWDCLSGDTFSTEIFNSWESYRRKHEAEFSWRRNFRCFTWQVDIEPCSRYHFTGINYQSLKFYDYTFHRRSPFSEWFLPCKHLNECQ